MKCFSVKAPCKSGAFYLHRHPFFEQMVYARVLQCNIAIVCYAVHTKESFFYKGISMDEIIEILDDAGQVIGTDYRSQVMQHNFVNFKLVSAFIRDITGNFIMFRRAYHKSRYGGKFGTVGGCVGVGESYQDAFFREVQEEIGIDVAVYSWRFLGYTNPRADATIGHTAVYEIIVPLISSYTQDDFAEMRIMSQQELELLCIENKEVTHNLPIYCRKFYNNF